MLGALIRNLSLGVCFNGLLSTSFSQGGFLWESFSRRLSLGVWMAWILELLEFALLYLNCDPCRPCQYHRHRHHDHLQCPHPTMTHKSQYKSLLFVACDARRDSMRLSERQHARKLHILACDRLSLRKAIQEPKFTKLNARITHGPCHAMARKQRVTRRALDM